MLKERLAGNPGPPGPTSWHLVTESGVDVRGDRATGTVTWALIQRGDGDKPVMRLLGHYDDVYVREHGRWRYRRRIAHTDIPYRKLDVPPQWAAGELGGLAESTAAGAADDMDARLGRLEDADQIRRLTQEYRRLLDARDLDGYGRLFAADGEWLGGTGYGQTPAGITAMLRERLPARSSDHPAAWHLVTEPEISLDGDRADRHGHLDVGGTRRRGYPGDAAARPLRRHLRARARPVAVPARGSPTLIFRTARWTCLRAWADPARWRRRRSRASAPGDSTAGAAAPAGGPGADQPAVRRVQGGAGQAGLRRLRRACSPRTASSSRPRAGPAAGQRAARPSRALVEAMPAQPARVRAGR